MKKNILTVLCAIMFMCTSMQAQDSENTQEIAQSLESAIITIEGMACQEGCADAISANLEKVSGVSAAMVSFTSGKAEIDFNPNEVSIDSLKAVITSTKVKDYNYTIEEVILVEEN